MNKPDFRPLQKYANLLRVSVWLKRIPMIAVRLIVISLLLVITAAVIWFALNTQTIYDATLGGTTTSETYSYSFSGSYSPGSKILLLIGGYIAIMAIWSILVEYQWSNFAKINNFSYSVNNRPTEVINVPSFRGKLLSSKSSPISGTYEDMPFHLFTRHYKEGGVLRWRERKMDSVICIDLPRNLPHITIDSRANEKARLSNLSIRPGAEKKFRFEGTSGAHYDVYASKMDRITALQLFTPDVLEVLYKELPTADVEIREQKLWIIERYKVLNSKTAEALFSSGHMLYQKLAYQGSKLIDRI